jgi:adenosylmethionine-8-amino-7-oxononanoate aminotransferase
MSDSDHFRELLDKDRQYFWHPATQMNAYLKSESIIIARGEGYKLWDISGKEYIDGNSGVWCVNLGYAQQRLIDAALNQLTTLPYTSLFAFVHEPAIELSAKLVDLMPNRQGKAFFVTDGSEAIETAIKMVRQLFIQNGESYRQIILSLREGYHGLSLGALSACGMPSFRKLFGNLLSGFYQVDPPFCFRCPWQKAYGSCDFSCINALKKEASFYGFENVAAILVEPILGSGGVIVPPKEYLPAVAAFAKEIGALLIVDEVTTGFGRTGTMFGFEHTGVQPDIVALAKGLTSGYLPLGAVVTSNAVYEAFLGGTGRAFAHAYTFGGHPASCAVALAALEVMRDNRVLEGMQDAGSYLLEKLLDLKTRTASIGDVRGLGLMYGIEFIDQTGNAISSAKGRAISAAALERGLIIRALGGAGHVLALLPPLIIDKEGIDEIVRRLELAIHDVLDIKLSQ